MIYGHVLGRQAQVGVTLRITGYQDLEIEFVVDTGFAGYLTLPPAAVSSLQLPFFQEIYANLADDSDVKVSVHTVTILWDGEEREVDVLATGSRPLIGTLLLDGYDVDIQFAEGGLVTIERL